MNNTQSISDLIYLLLDNEATTFERQSLFHELASQPDLQVEFQEALTAKIALEKDVAATYIPSDLEKSLFKKAGIPLLIPPSGWSRVGQFFSGKLFFAVASFVSGCLLSLLLFNYASKDAQTASANGSNEVTIASRTYKSPDGIAHTVSSETQPVANTAKAGKGIEKSHYRSENWRGNGNNGLSMSAPDAAWAGRNHADASANQYSTADTPVFKANERSTAQISASRKAYPDRLPAEFANRPTLGARHTQSFTLFPSNFDGFSFMPIEFLENLSVEFSGLQNLQLYPARSAGTTGNQFFKNACFSVKYNINPNHAIGFSGGSETFPMYVPTSEGLAGKPNMAWFGGFYQYTSDRIWSNFMPYGKAFVGGNDYGTLLKTELGIGWQPDEKVRFLISLDGTQFFYYYKENWHGAQKLGFKYGLEIFF